ncbi:hypothetical protein HNY73_009849 [Argiope bruennichi]|uniref:Uncharacterized protein n=1 Tax=Argiope bruennichi TaxID=94029 RepID=A0A8T0FD91_ARGBR|nr:hypothetical protein HNY73_009849 [Argiope bruennichi]
MSFLYHEVERKEQRVLAETSFGIAFLDQPKICSSLPKIHDENLLTELASRGIKLTDVGKDTPPIKDLLGADVLGSILTGKNRDVSARGYACYVFLRYDKEAGVKVSFTLAKARVVPVQRPTIPRQKVSEAADLTIIQSMFIAVHWPSAGASSCIRGQGRHDKIPVAFSLIGPQSKILQSHIIIAINRASFDSDGL